MSYKIPLPDLTNNPKTSQITDIEDKIFNFTFTWNELCECVFVDIYDELKNPIILGRALTTNSVIRTDLRKLPKVLYFQHKSGDTYEPTQENFSEDFILAYE
jgi:hypothetical protein